MQSNNHLSTPAPTGAPQVLEELFQRAEAANASDIHLQMEGQAAVVAFRLDGVITPVSRLESGMAEKVVGRIKYLARLKTYQDSMPQDGRIEKAEAHTRQDVRVATYPAVTGEKIVLRLFTQTAARALIDLGLAEPVRRELEESLRLPFGLILLTGPAGSGKTTTIYACLQHLASQGGRHIITVEDPVEQVLPGVMQTEVSEERGLTFGKAARHLLRQDPQVLAIGEIRDEETANIVVQASLTGHLVISTLHTGSCKGVVERLLVMCPDQFAVASTLELVLNQRLMRRLCLGCHGAGCDTCCHTGYRGRIPVVEWFRLNNAVRRQLREQGPDIISPPTPIRTTAAQLVSTGVTTQAEYERVFGAELPGLPMG